MERSSFHIAERKAAPISPQHDRNPRTASRRRTSALATMLLAALFQPSDILAEADEVTHPVVSREACPLIPVAPEATDGHHGTGFLRKPPGSGPFPALVWVHGGLTTRSAEALEEYAVHGPPARYLAAGYVAAVVTYRSRDHDPQSTVSRDDVIAAVEYLRNDPYVDPQSIVIFGCSGGGDLAIEVAAATEVSAIAAEEPASMLLTGIFSKSFPKTGKRFTARDAGPISADPDRYYTEPYQRITRDKLSRITCPMMILQGEPTTPLNRFNARVLIPDLALAGIDFRVKTYPGEPHCFAFYGRGNRTPNPTVALQAFHDSDAFFRRHITRQPIALDNRIIHHVSVD